jgi:DNA-nicking Smr family endonuclease
MAKKKKNFRRGAEEDTDQIPKQKPVSFSPFKDLKKMLADKAVENGKQSLPIQQLPVVKATLRKPVAQPSKPSAPAPPPISEVVDEDSILREAYAGVRPLGAAPTGHRMPVVPEIHRSVVSEEAEVLAALSDLVSGVGNFDLTETDEYVEGARVGLDPRLLTRLRRGEFAVQDHIDLHGMIQPDAKLALQHFVIKSVGKGIRTVLVVHGRGLGSPGGRPILKHAAAQWLSHGEIGAHVHAFATAKAQDGGAGAMYVLLRRDRRRAAFDVLQGAKRRD